MRVLWVTAQLLPIVYDDFTENNIDFGGWIFNMIKQLESVDNLSIGIAMVTSNKNLIGHKKYRNIDLFIAQEIGTKNISKEDRDRIIESFKPDLIHIEGTEFAIQNSFSKYSSIPNIVSIQGILGAYEPYQYGELPIADYMFSPKYKNVLTSWILYFRKHLLFDKRLEYEIDTIKNAKNLTGRTFWDRAHSYWINSQANYYKCNRILRNIFYKEKWNIIDAEPHSLYIGNGYSPLKGLHFAIEAIAKLKKEYPDIRLYVSGEKPIIEKGSFVYKKGYSAYLKRLINKHSLENNIIFTGKLNAEEMVSVMKKCRAYILPSLIENSPNTLGEAMMVGLPCISAYTGGASEMAVDGDECLFYRANDPSLLAWNIKRIFSDDELANRLSINARKHALETHDPIINRDMLISAYNSILKN